MSETALNRGLCLPNLLTLLRLVAVVPIILLFRQGHDLASAVFFAVAMASDVLDGWLARHLNQCSALGLYLDPVVDKILTLTLFYELARAGIVDDAAAHLFLARELLQNAVRNAAAARGQVVGANWMGKTKATLQTIVITAGLLAPAAGGWLAPSVRVGAWFVLLLSWVFFILFVSWNRHAIGGGEGTPHRQGGHGHDKET